MPQTSRWSLEKPHAVCTRRRTCRRNADDDHHRRRCRHRRGRSSRRRSAGDADGDSCRAGKPHRYPSRRPVGSRGGQRCNPICRRGRFCMRGRQTTPTSYLTSLTRPQPPTQTSSQTTPRRIQLQPCSCVGSDLPTPITNHTSPQTAHTTPSSRTLRPNGRPVHGSRTCYACLPKPTCRYTWGLGGSGRHAA